MALKITTIQSPKVSAQYYDRTFMALLQSHVDYFKSLSSTSTVILDNERIQRNLGDFESLLMDLGVERHYHWFVYALNGIYANHEFNENVTQILIPDRSEIDRIRMSYATTQRVSL